MTFDPKDISYALALLRTAVECAHVYRKKDGSIIGNLAQFVKGASLDAMTLLQRHAELIYAEAYLLKALITILNDESFVSFIREGTSIPELDSPLNESRDKHPQFVYDIQAML